MLDTATLGRYRRNHSAAQVLTARSGGGASGGRLLCGICRDDDAVVAGQCRACYSMARRQGHESPQDRDDRLARKRDVTLRDPVPDDRALTFGEWCQANGYDPQHRTYEERA